jgi:hypothetical protein
MNGGQPITSRDQLRSPPPYSIFPTDTADKTKSDASTPTETGAETAAVKSEESVST